MRLSKIMVYHPTPLPPVHIGAPVSDPVRIVEKKPPIKLGFLNRLKIGLFSQ